MDDQRANRTGSGLTKREAILVAIFFWMLRAVFVGWTAIGVYLIASTDFPRRYEALAMGLMGAVLTEVMLWLSRNDDVIKRWKKK